MSKRFSDSDDWDDGWYLDLKPKMKELWRYMKAKCDQAGVWRKPDLSLASNRVGENINAEEFERDFIKTGKVLILRSGFYFLVGFIEEQYLSEKHPTLSENAPLHKKVIDLLKMHGIDRKPCLNPQLNESPSQSQPDPIAMGINTHKEEEGKRIGSNSSRKGGVGENQPSVVPIQAFSPEEIKLCSDALESTLEAFGIERPVLSHEEMTIGVLMRRYGAKSTAYALYGMQFEPANDNFDPKKHVAVSRLLEEEKFEKALNRGVAEKTKLKKAEEAHQRQQAFQALRQAEVEAAQ